MDPSNFDEFGNYIGPELSGSEEEEDEEEEVAYQDRDEEMQDRDSPAEGVDTEVGYEPDTQLVLHEDKKYYPTAEEVYGKDTETLVMEEDAQPLEVPIIAPVKQKKFQVVEQEAVTNYKSEFLTGLMGSPLLTRNVVIAGHLHHGKTVVMDMFVQQTHKLQDSINHADEPLRFTDTRIDEQERGISLKMIPMSLVTESSASKSYLFNIIDTPGHVNFQDEVSAAIRVADGLLLVVDAVEGVMLVTEKVVRQALSEGLPIVLLITKVDRLITELKLPPTDAYHKLHHTIQEVNALIATYSGGVVDLEVRAYVACLTHTTSFDGINE